jgi:hypothetical protein
VIAYGLVAGIVTLVDSGLSAKPHFLSAQSPSEVSTQQVCTFTASQPVLLPSQGGAATITITAPSGCSWTAQSDATFISITSPASGTGSGSISISAPPNTGMVRGATLTIGHASRFTTAKIVQDGPDGSVACVTAMRCGGSCVSPFPFPGGGWSSQVVVGAPETCGWIARPTAPWIAVYPLYTVENQPYGVGAGRFGFRVEPNPTAGRRTASIEAGGASYPITQAPCTFVVSPPTASAPASGGTAVISVTTSCPSTWMATTEASFLTITSGSSGTGSGTVNVSVAANSGAARVATVIVAGQPVTITQSAAAPPL